MLGFILWSLIIFKKKLNDCRFECNYLQNKLYKFEELNEYIPAMKQILSPVQIAELKALTLQIRNEKYEIYEGRELPFNL